MALNATLGRGLTNFFQCIFPPRRHSNSQNKDHIQALHLQLENSINNTKHTHQLQYLIKIEKLKAFWP